jgi:hypothetical protein
MLIARKAPLNPPFGKVVLFGFFPLLLLAPAVKAQVWVDANQLDGKLPEWVDKQYYQSPTRTVWVAATYRTIPHRIWHEAVYRTTIDRVWVEGHYETRRIPVNDDPCGCNIIREERIWVPGHYNCIERRVCVSPGYWEEVVARELVTPGHWEEVRIEGRN